MENGFTPSEVFVRSFSQESPLSLLPRHVRNSSTRNPPYQLQ